MQSSRYKIVIFAVFAIVSAKLNAQTDFSIENIKKIGLPIVNISTVDGEEPTCEFVTHPEGSYGEGITNTNKVPCRIIVTKGDETLYDSGEYEKNISGATIKVNGNTSAYHDNKPYKIKLQTKEDLLFRGNKKYKDKEWRLLKDALTLNTMIGLKLNELIGLTWTPAYCACNVFVNGDYRGCYLLIESVKRNSDCRLNVDKDTGFIVERDAYWWNEETYFATNYFSPYNYYRYTWKYPDEEDVIEEQLNAVRNFINQAEEAILQGNYEQYIDIQSFAAWILAHDMLGTWDSGGSNLYVMRYDNTSESLLQMANMWDFDTCFWMEKGEFSKIHSGSTDFYFSSLFNNANKAFVRAYKQKWNEVKDNIPQQIIEYVQAFSESEEGKALQASREYHARLWNKELNTVEEDVNKLIDWFEGHLPLLDKAITSIDENTSTIVPSLHHNIYKLSIYDIQGNSIDKPRKGLNIINGKKVILRQE